MATTIESRQLSDAVLSFSIDGRFPDEISALSPVSETDLGPSIESLEAAKIKLEAEIHTINEETREDVSSWVKNAKTLQEDILRSKDIANNILRQSEAPDISGELIKEAENKTEFLAQETQYNKQLRDVLASIQYVNELLNEVEQASKELRILDSLRLLEKSWSALDEVGVSKTTRIMKLLDLRAFELKSDVHEVFDHVWKALVQVDIEARRLAIHDTHNDETMSLSDAVIGLKSYKEVDERMEQLWRNLDTAIIMPRMNINATAVLGIRVEMDMLEIIDSNDNSVSSLLSDLREVFAFLARKLPSDLLRSLCRVMMPDIIPRLTQDWLNPAVPSGLTDMTLFQETISKAKEMCETLAEGGYTDFDELRQWAEKAPMIWLDKCRESTLDSVRRKLINGVGESKTVEKIEKQMVSVSEGNELSATGAGAAADTNEWGADWGDAWGEEEDQSGEVNEPPQEAKSKAHAPGDDNDDGTDAWGWDDNEDAQDQAPEAVEDDDTSAEAWGWDDESAPVESKPSTTVLKKDNKKPQKDEMRELILKETYNISAMPEPVLQLIFSILEDGATLLRGVDEYSLVAATAPGLFTLPTFALALFRAISPHYYSLDVGGNMFLYNDAMYLAEKLSDFSSTWKQREDLTPRARSMLRIDNEVRTLKSFANRSYTNEMNIQKTILQDLMGGSQSVMQQDEKEAAVEQGTARIRTMAATWEPILARSVWSQAIGSLTDSLAMRLITDVLDMSAIGQEEAYSIAKLIASATELDDLFLPSKLSGGFSTTSPVKDELPATAQYAPHWLRLKYLSEVLQSNLNEVKFLWCDSELSLYFSTEEVIDLIYASFEDNARTRETIKEIRATPARV